MGWKVGGTRLYTSPIFHMRQNEYIQSDVDACWFAKIYSNGSILISVTIYDFLIAESTAQLMNAFYEFLAAKYTVRTLG